MKEVPWIENYPEDDESREETGKVCDICGEPIYAGGYRVSDGAGKYAHESCLFDQTWAKIAEWFGGELRYMH